MVRVCTLYPRDGFARLSTQPHAADALADIASLGALATARTAHSFEPGYLEVGDCWEFEELSRTGWEKLLSICPSPPVKQDDIEVDGRPGVKLHSAPTVSGAFSSRNVFRADFEPPYPLFQTEERPPLIYVRADLAAELVETTDGVLARYRDSELEVRERQSRISMLPNREDDGKQSPWLPFGLVRTLCDGLTRAWEQVQADPLHRDVYGFGVQHIGGEYRLHVASEGGLEAVVTSVMKQEAGDIRPVLRREWRHALPGDALTDPLKTALDDANRRWPSYLERPGLRIAESLLRRSVAIRALRHLDRRGLFDTGRDHLVLEVIDTLNVGARIDEAGALNPRAHVERLASEIAASRGVRRSTLSSTR